MPDTKQTESSSNYPFVSEQAKYIFILTKMDGKQRSDALGVGDDHWEDETVATEWYQRISNIIQGGPNAEAAKHTLTQIYKYMVS